MSENQDSEYDRSSIAPSMNPSMAPSRAEGSRSRKVEEIVPRNNDIKSIKDELKDTGTISHYKDNEILKRFPRADKVMLGLNCMKSKVGGIKQILDRNALF
jgi:hypothetical protein